MSISQNLDVTKGGITPEQTTVGLCLLDAGFPYPDLFNATHRLRCEMVKAAEFFREATTTPNSEISPDFPCDEELVRRAQEEGDKAACEYLLHKYKNLVKAKVKSYFLVGAEREDLVQIGLIGLWEAISDFRADRHTSFASFAKVCIQRQMISAIKAATRQKQVPLNSSVSLETSPLGDDDDDGNLLDVISSRTDADPESMVLSIEGEKILQ